MEFWKGLFGLFVLGLVVEASIVKREESEKKSHHWSYHREYDTNHWAQDFPICGLEQQSPIDIILEDTIYNADLSGISLAQEAPSPLKLLNNGHTVVGVVGGEVSVVGGGLEDNAYKTHSLHFHWGADASQGSEHFVNSRQFPLELHIVNYDSSRFSSLKDAAPEAKGLAVLGVLFEESAEDNEALGPIIEALSMVQSPLGKENIHTLENFDVTSLLPSNTLEYFRYDGSLTTPPCYESVIWTVFAVPATVSHSQLEAFRSLVESTNDDLDEIQLVNNYRSVQALNGRVVSRSFEELPKPELYEKAENAGVEEGPVEYEDSESEPEEPAVPEAEGAEPEEPAEPEQEEMPEKKPEKKFHHWSYEGTDGPSHWKEHFAQCDSNNPRQSPINIVEDESVEDESGDLMDIDLIQHEGASDKISYFNNGHTVVGVVHKDVSLVGGGLRDVYKFHSFHFHWGRTSAEGSEHTVDGKSFPLELHMVHYDKEKAPSLKEAVPKHNGLAVLGTLFEISPENNTAFDPVISVLREVKTPNKQVDKWVSSTHVDLRSFLPAVTADFYRYEGSLTTPPCSESVIWTVFRQRQIISEAQMEEFRQLLEVEKEGSEAKLLVDNFRPVQPLHKRIVTRSFHIEQPVAVDAQDPVVQRSRVEVHSGSPKSSAPVLWIVALSILLSKL